MVGLLLSTLEAYAQKLLEIEGARKFCNNCSRLKQIEYLCTNEICIANYRLTFITKWLRKYGSTNWWEERYVPPLIT